MPKGIFHAVVATDDLDASLRFLTDVCGIGPVQPYSPTPITSGLMNTGNLIFQQHPIYISYGGNTSTVY